MNVCTAWRSTLHMTGRGGWRDLFLWIFHLQWEYRLCWARLLLRWPLHITSHQGGDCKERGGSAWPPRLLYGIMVQDVLFWCWCDKIGGWHGCEQRFTALYYQNVQQTQTKVQKKHTHNCVQCQWFISSVHVDIVCFEIRLWNTECVIRKKTSNSSVVKPCQICLDSEFLMYMYRCDCRVQWKSSTGRGLNKIK